MSGPEHDRVLAEFETRLQRWGGRPPFLDPVVAAARVAGRLDERRPPAPWLRLAAVAAMLLVIAVAVWRSAPGRPPLAAATGSEVVGSSEVVQFWLDSETPVHFVLRPFGVEKGESS